MQQFSGINAVAVYGGDIAGKAVSGELALLMPSLINLEQVLATFVTSYLLTRFGRRTILLYGALFEGIACGFVMIGFFIKDTSGGQSLILLGLFLFTAVFGLSLGPVVWLYIPEIVQPKIVPYSTASNWISASLVIILFPIATDDLLNGNPGVLFIFFTAWCLGSFVFNNLFVLETKDKT
jgi:MFS family permease